MGLGHIFTYCTSFRYRFLYCPGTWGIDSEWISPEKSGPGCSWGETPWTTFFWESFPSTFEEFAGSFCFFLDPVGLQSEILEETSGNIFLELPNLSWSNLPLPVALESEGLVGSTPNFIGLVVFFFKQRRLHFGMFSSTCALPTRVVAARCCPWLWKQAALLRGWGSSSFKDSRLNDHLWFRLFPPKV